MEPAVWGARAGVVHGSVSPVRLSLGRYRCPWPERRLSAPRPRRVDDGCGTSLLPAAGVLAVRGVRGGFERAARRSSTSQLGCSEQTVQDRMTTTTTEESPPLWPTQHHGGSTPTRSRSLNLPVPALRATRPASSITRSGRRAPYAGRRSRSSPSACRAWVTLSSCSFRATPSAREGATLGSQ